jgi:ABC-type glycerol-3-phosphate transport system substrate-binding protein
LAAAIQSALSGKATPKEALSAAKTEIERIK